MKEKRMEEKSGNLNSILIEGELLAEPTFDKDENGNIVSSFNIKSRISKENNSLNIKGYNYFKIKCTDDLADAVIENGQKGREFRIVGCLVHEEFNDDYFIYAEHIEFKPS
jgi:single-strand DNA-binding protein